MSKYTTNPLNIEVKETTNELDNLQAVAEMLGLQSKYNKQTLCRMIIDYLKKQAPTNANIKYILEHSSDDASVCQTMVEALYLVFKPYQIPNSSPMNISNKVYKELLEKVKNGIKLTSSETAELDEALNVKYCYCAKRLYIKNKLTDYISGQPSVYSPYAICAASIYKNRHIDMPPNLARNCKVKYSWYNDGTQK